MLNMVETYPGESNPFATKVIYNQIIPDENDMDQERGSDIDSDNEDHFENENEHIKEEKDFQMKGHLKELEGTGKLQKEQLNEGEGNKSVWGKGEEQKKLLKLLNDSIDYKSLYKDIDASLLPLNEAFSQFAAFPSYQNLTPYDITPSYNPTQTTPAPSFSYSFPPKETITSDCPQEANSHLPEHKFDFQEMDTKESMLTQNWAGVVKNVEGERAIKDEAEMDEHGDDKEMSESERDRRSLFRIVGAGETVNKKNGRKYKSRLFPLYVECCSAKEPDTKSLVDEELEREDLLHKVSVEMLEDAIKKINEAKKLNMRINRKRKRGPEPSNSALYYYRMDVLEEVSERYPNASPSDIVEVVQNQWEKLDKKSKEQYHRLAQLDQKRFDEEAKQYIPRSEGGTMKRPKRKKHPRAPKHPMSAYLYFVSDHRAQLKQQNPSKNFTQIAKLLGERWKSIDSEVRKEYEHKAEEDKARYRKEKMVFEPGPVVMDGKKRKKHPLAPKHPLSGYLYFVANNRADFNKKYPDKDFTEVAKILGEHWKSLPSKEKRKYQILAAADKKRYEEEKQKWQPPIEREHSYIQMPKKPMTAYSYWAYNQRALLIQSNPFFEKKEFTRLLRDRWNKISEREKALYNEKAEMDRQRYQRELYMLPKQYRSQSIFPRVKREERLMNISPEIPQWSATDVQKFLQICGINYETAKKFSLLNINGNEFIQLSTSKLRNNIGLINFSEIKRICKIIWILSLS